MTIETWEKIGRLLENLVIFCLFIMVIASTIVGNNITMSIALICLSSYAFEYVSLKRKLREKEERIKELENVIYKVEEKIKK